MKSISIESQFSDRVYLDETKMPAVIYKTKEGGLSDTHTTPAYIPGISFAWVFKNVPTYQVASDWAVTAAHCVVDRRPSEMILRLGNEFDADNSAANATFR